MQSENLLRSDYNQVGGIGGLENNNNMMNHSESGSNSNSPIQSYAISPNQQVSTSRNSQIFIETMFTNIWFDFRLYLHLQVI